MLHNSLRVTTMNALRNSAAAQAPPAGLPLFMSCNELGRATAGGTACAKFRDMFRRLISRHSTSGAARRGFTLIEMIIVITALGLLLAVGVPKIGRQISSY